MVLPYDNDPKKKESVLEQTDRKIQELDQVRANTTLSPVEKEQRIKALELEIASLRKINGPRHHKQM